MRHALNTSGSRVAARLLSAAVLWLIAMAGSLPAAELRIPVGTFSGINLTVRQQVLSVEELRKRDLTIQELDYSCGSAALATLLNAYLQIPVTEREIIDHILKTGDLRKIIARRAFSLLDLKRFATSRGAEAEGYSLTFDELIDLQQPMLVPIVIRGYRHFVIFRGMKDGRVYLADPSFGRWTLARAEFERMWKLKVGLGVWPKYGPTLPGNAMRLNKEDEVYVSSPSTSSLCLGSGLQFGQSPHEF